MICAIWNTPSLAFDGFAATTGGAMNVSDEDSPDVFVAPTYRLMLSDCCVPVRWSAATFCPRMTSAALIGRDSRYNLWADRYSGDAQVIGRVVKINDVPTMIIGVMPPGFTYPVAELWQPLVQSPSLAAPALSRTARNLGVIARLKGDVSSARAEVDTIADRLAQEHPETNKDVRIVVRR